MLEWCLPLESHDYSYTFLTLNQYGKHLRFCHNIHNLSVVDTSLFDYRFSHCYIEGV